MKFGRIDEESQQKASQAMLQAYQSGTLADKGNIRHLLTTDDFSEEAAWEIYVRCQEG